MRPRIPRWKVTGQELTAGVFDKNKRVKQPPTLVALDAPVPEARATAILICPRGWRGADIAIRVTDDNVRATIMGPRAAGFTIVLGDFRPGGGGVQPLAGQSRKFRAHLNTLVG